MRHETWDVMTSVLMFKGAAGFNGPAPGAGPGSSQGAGAGGVTRPGRCLGLAQLHALRAARTGISGSKF
jgi:hypothetical protein